ncbi:polysaccharide deacetylase family protein [Gottfriedia sp. NPDC057948]|uniref:polysaccharide deacetylase family protein n=1 Tax=Gottfriedia sp. NPDC057948 TaxID=3346287 RepID=UPI0036D9DD48
MKKLILVFLIAGFIIYFTYKFRMIHHSTKLENQKDLVGQGCVVLNYHLISPDRDKFIRFLTKDPEFTTYNIYKSDFEKQIDVLKRNHVKFITPRFLDEYMRSKIHLTTKQKCVLLTFDDVDQSVYRNAYPILKKNRIPFTIFLIMGQVGNNDYNGINLANWKQINEMQKSGLATYGTHTYNLHYYNKNGQPPFIDTKNIKAFQKDLRLATKTYKQHFGEQPHYFAYPYGYGTPQTDQTLINDGYKMIFSLRYGLNRPNDPTFFVKRILLTYDNWEKVNKWIESK